MWYTLWNRSCSEEYIQSGVARFSWCLGQVTKTVTPNRNYKCIKKNHNFFILKLFILPLFGLCCPGQLYHLPSPAQGYVRVCVYVYTHTHTHTSLKQPNLISCHLPWCRSPVTVGYRNTDMVGTVDALTYLLQINDEHFNLTLKSRLLLLQIINLDQQCLNLLLLLLQASSVLAATVWIKYVHSKTLAGSWFRLNQAQLP